MKKLPFVKMHGIWNDFIMINIIDLDKISTILTPELIQKMCDRNFWIGSDWVVVITKRENVPFKYIMYNPDWTQAEMCGNWIRCYMKYLLEQWITTKTNINVETWIWILNLDIKKNIVTVDMWRPSKIKNLVYESKKLWDKFPLKINKAEFTFTPISMWNPHAVIFCKDMNICWSSLDNMDIKTYGSIIENYTDIFPDRTNVEFAKIISKTEVNMRVWERGAAETLACWTWACATVVAWILAWRLVKNEFVKVKLAWWDLKIKWSWNEKDSVIMKGEAIEVFEGFYHIN